MGHMDSLSVQNLLFHNRCSSYPCSSSGETAEVLRRLPVEVRGLFDQIEVLIRILFVVPVSSCEAERSFSALRRLEIWLRACMGQERLNGIVVCNVHKDRLVSRENICQQFEPRKHMFGSFVQ